MRRPLRDFRRLRHVLVSSLALAIVIHLPTICTTFTSPSLYQTSRDVCKFAYVTTVSPTCVPTDAHPSCWNVLVTSGSHPTKHRLSLPENHGNFLSSELALLHRLNGCQSLKECNSSTPCSYGVEDPSDAFWLRRYANSSKFVVLFNIGLVSLIFFICAIVVDGSIFYPHRQGLALASASVLIMLSISALLYVLLVPRHFQFALYGKGVWNSIAYVFIIFFIASLLPAFAVIWISTVLFFIFFLGFMFEHALIVLFSTVHFVVVFVAYQVANTALHVRLVYFSDDEDSDETEYEARLLAMGENFMRRIRSNWFIRRLPRILEERALQITQNHMPDHVHEQLLRESSLSQVVEETHTNQDPNRTSLPLLSTPSQSVPSRLHQNTVEAPGVNEASPLLSSDSIS